MGNRTPDIQLAKLTLYQLSYTPLLGHATIQLKKLRIEKYFSKRFLRQCVPCGTIALE